MTGSGYISTAHQFELYGQDRNNTTHNTECLRLKPHHGTDQLQGRVCTGGYLNPVTRDYPYTQRPLARLVLLGTVHRNLGWPTVWFPVGGFEAWTCMNSLFLHAYAFFWRSEC
jgi:hypothetical protein